jgi:mannose-1-phosphate guanylyltransferase / mannose-6-phosphate isomerase
VREVVSKMNLEKFLINKSETILDALIKIDINKKGFLIVIDQNNKVLGTLTDGDIRRAFIAGLNITDYIDNAYNKKFEKVFLNDGLCEIIETFKRSKIKFLPIIDKNGFFKNIITKNNLHVLLLGDIDFNLEYDFSSLSDEILEHEIYNRPWGFYKTTYLSSYSQSKIIKVNPKGELSLQEHKRREEHWVIISGYGEITIGESKKEVVPGDFIYIPKGCKHKIVNTSVSRSLMVAEVQIGDYFGEDDIIRYEDKYGRK